MAKRPPNELKPNGRGRRFYKWVHERFEIEDPHHERLLIAACKCLDDEARAEKEIAKKGSFFVDRFGQPKASPAYQVLKDSRIMFARLMRELQLDATPPPEARPTRMY